MSSIRSFELDARRRRLRLPALDFCAVSRASGLCGAPRHCHPGDPLAVAVVDRPQQGANDNTFLFFVLFVVIGSGNRILDADRREFTRRRPHRIADRIAGAMLGIVRVFLLGVLGVIALERLIPPARQPPWMTQSVFRPALSAAGERGLHKLPPAPRRLYRSSEKRKRALITPGPDSSAPCRRARPVACRTAGTDSGSRSWPAPSCR